MSLIIDRARIHYAYVGFISLVIDLTTSLWLSKKKKKVLIEWKPYSRGSLLCTSAIPQCCCRLLLKSAHPARRLVNPEYSNDFPSLSAMPHCEVIHVSMWGGEEWGGKERMYVLMACSLQKPMDIHPTLLYLYSTMLSWHSTGDCIICWNLRCVTF